MTAWPLPGRFGTESWHTLDGRLLPFEIGGKRLAGPSNASLLDSIGARDGVCAHPGPWPNAFRFCPECGASLGAAFPPDRSPPWSPPFGAGDGLPDVAVAGAPDPASREEIAMPASTAIGLAVAGTPSRLLCCDRASGWISVFSERDRGWHRLTQLPGCAELPRSSWSGVATTDGLAVPTDRGPAFVELRDPVRAGILLPDAPCRPLGGAAAIGGTVLAPVQQDGALAIAVLGGDGWVLQPVESAIALPGPLFSPVATTDAAFWCGDAGQLVVHSTADGLQARFSPWSDDVLPLPGVRPVAGRDGTLHQLCRLDAATLVHDALALPNHPRGRRVARGYSPGTGRAVFRENTRLRLPWDERAACDYPLDDDRFLLPLLHLGGDRFLLAVCTDRARLGGFLGDPLAAAATPDAPPVACTLVFSRGPRMLEPLDCVLRAHAACDLSVAVHDGWLLVHGAVENRCHRWRLRDAG